MHTVGAPLVGSLSRGREDCDKQTGHPPGVPLRHQVLLLFRALEVAAHFLVDLAYVRGVAAYQTRLRYVGETLHNFNVYAVRVTVRNWEELYRV